MKYYFKKYYENFRNCDGNEKINNRQFQKIFASFVRLLHIRAKLQKQAQIVKNNSLNYN